MDGAWGEGVNFLPPASGCIIEFKSRGFHLPSCQIEFGVIALCTSTVGCHVYFFHGELLQHQNFCAASAVIAYVNVIIL